MAHRTDAGGIGSLILLLVAGCATLGKREPAPANPPQPAATGPAKTESIRLMSAPQQSDLTPDRPAIYQVQDSPDADSPRRLYRDALAAYARQPSYIARLKRREWANGQPRPE